MIEDIEIGQNANMIDDVERFLLVKFFFQNPFSGCMQIRSKKTNSTIQRPCGDLC